MKREKDSPYMYWLYSIEGLGKKKMDMLLNICKTAKGVYLMREDLIDELGFLTKNDKEALKVAKKSMEINRKYEELKSKKITFLTLKDREYPDKLRCIPDPPYGIFCSGRLPNPELPCVAIIGSRQCTEYGRYVAEQLGKTFAKANIQVISGMARGIDSIAQRAAMEAGGETFGVLGCGVDVCYPAECNHLYKQLKERGGLISEYPPGTEPKAQYFPRRNRIISGLSDAVIVVEARERSGTLITVDMALEQGREVYVVPGRMTDPLSVGCNRLMRQGAEVVTDLAELVHDVHQLHTRQWGMKQENKKSENRSQKVSMRDEGELCLGEVEARQQVESKSMMSEKQEKVSNVLNRRQKEIIRILYMEGKCTQQIYSELCEQISVDIATFSDELFQLEQIGNIYYSEGYYYLR